MEEIKLSDEISVYRTKISIPKKDILITDLMYNMDVATNTKKPTPTEPGIQSPIVITTESIKYLHDSIMEIMFQNFGESENCSHFYNEWIYMSENKNPYMGWHKHDNPKHTNIPHKWTYTYYVQMPDNLVGDDGKLAFRMPNGEIKMILPEDDDLLIFPCTAEHAPMTNTRSTVPRIVFAGVWSDININEKIRKREKTLL